MIHLHVLIQIHKIKIIDQHEAHHYGLASIKSHTRLALVFCDWFYYTHRKIQQHRNKYNNNTCGDNVKCAQFKFSTDQ